MKNFIGSIIAGILIGIGCVINAKIGGLIGALLFATGLVTIITFKFPLFTGIVANKFSKSFIINSLITLCGNCIGAYIINLMYSPILSTLTIPHIQIFVLSCGTGVLMVSAYKSKNYIVAIMGVTLFIMCGWYHCIAEVGYCRMEFSQWLMALFGNIVGGQIFRIYDYIDNKFSDNNV